MRKCCFNAACGSVGPSCRAQEMLSPLLAHLDLGKKNSVWARFPRSNTTVGAAAETCMAGSKAFRLGMVVSPSLAQDQNVVVRQA